MEEENYINKEKCAVLHNDFTQMHDNSHNHFHKCEKEIEIKVAEVKRLKDKLNKATSELYVSLTFSIYLIYNNILKSL